MDAARVMVNDNDGTADNGSYCNSYNFRDAEQAGGNKMTTELPTSTTGSSSTTTKGETTATHTPSQQQQETGGDHGNPHKPSCCMSLFLGNREALGWVLSNTGQGIYLIGAGAFILPSILHLAYIEAGCVVVVDAVDVNDTGAVIDDGSVNIDFEVDMEDCTNKIYGMKPSSLVTAMSTVIGIVVAIITPIIGSIVDYTSYRRLIGRILSILYVVLIIPQIFISTSNWFVIFFGYLILFPIMWSQTLIVHAYLPELTTSEKELNHFTKLFSVIPFISIILFVITVLVVATILGIRDNEIDVARIAALLSFTILSILYCMSWSKLMGKRPALNSTLQSDRRRSCLLLFAGFQQTYRTSIKIYNEYSALGWFYVGIAFGDVKTIASVSITFLTDFLQFTPTQNGLATIIMIVGTIPGALLSSYCSHHYNPIYSSMISMTLMIIFLSVAALILTGPSQITIYAYIIVFGWGIAGGMKHTSSRMLAPCISPKGQETELMGFYLFADHSLSFLPPLVYTWLNEANISPRIGMASLSIYFCIALVSCIKMGNYKDAVKIAGRLDVDEENNHDEEGEESNTEEKEQRIVAT